MGGGYFRAERIFFFVNISLAGIFLPNAKSFFSGLLAVHEVFSLNSPFYGFFLDFARPHNFFNGRPLLSL